jgi:hypothetical protein
VQFSSQDELPVPSSSDSSDSESSGEEGDENELISYITLFNKHYPGTISALAERVRQNWVNGIVKFLHDNGVTNVNTEEPFIPRRLKMRFYRWVDEKADEGTFSRPKKKKRVIKNVASRPKPTLPQQVAPPAPVEPVQTDQDEILRKIMEDI